MGLFKQLRMRVRVAKRLGAFSRASKQGMSVEEARFISDRLYPPTVEDIQYENQLRQTETLRFPWLSALSLLYPIASMAYLATAQAPLSMIVGHGIASLAYLLFVAGIGVGKFGVFGLKKRWQIFLLAIFCFALGTYLVNA